MKRIFSFVIGLLLCITLLSSCNCPSFTVNLEKENPSRYGHIKTTILAPVFYAVGYDVGDVVNVSFNNYNLQLPVVSAYEHVESGQPAVVIRDGIVLLAVNMGNFKNTYNVTYPITIKISLAQKDSYQIIDFVRTNNKEDYSHLTDEEFANFRKVNTNGMHNLYRSSNPVNPELGRNLYADNACKKAGIVTVLNLADTQKEAHSRDAFKGSYYSSCNVKYLALGTDLMSDEFRNALADGLRFMSQNKGPYLVHCTEGKDRAGFVNAVLECLMGAEAREVADDYMATYYNYYGVEKDSELFERILNSNIVKSLEQSFEIDDFWTANLQQAAREYIHCIGLSYNEIDRLISNL